MQVRNTSTEEHRSKRKYQPSITSYFEVRDDFEHHQDLRGLDPITRPRHHAPKLQQQQQRDRLAPEVPGQVQADLLSVGMRVRKSVPEGYKTQKMPTLPSIQTTLSTTKPSLDVKPPREAVPEDYVHQRELLPFCGLHKIGGFAEQPTTNLHLYGGLDAHGTRPTNLFPLPAEAFHQPFSSHSSTDSGYSTASSSQQHLPNPLNSSKRSWQDEDDKPLNSNFFFSSPMKGFGGMGSGGAEMDEVPVSPLSETPPQSFNIMPAARQFAQPKSRRAHRPVGGDDDMGMDLDYENATQIEARVAAGSGSDFEEADFLAREVDMGGI